MVSEQIAFVVVLCAALVPLLACRGKVPIQPATVKIATVGFWTSVPVAILLLATSWRLPLLAKPEPLDRPVQQPGDGYVGSDSCRICHAEAYASWHASYHRTMTQLASPAAVIGDFDNVELKEGNGVYRLSRVSDEFWVDLPDPYWLAQTQAAELSARLKSGALPTELRRGWDEFQAGKEPSLALIKALEDIVLTMEINEPAPRLRRPIVMTTGSHHMQAYWYSQGLENSRELGLLPFVYLAAEQRWIPRNSAFLRPHERVAASETGRWNLTCLKCHTTHGQSRLAPGVLDTRAAEFGIACEACHGPGERHVAVNRDPRRRYAHHLSGSSDPTIVQPPRLPHRRSSQVCGQCHGILDGYRAVTPQEELWSGSPFRPGADLEHVARVVRRGRQDEARAHGGSYEQKAEEFDIQFWSDGMVRVSGREYNGLIETPCFQRGELSCLSCHQMHQSAGDTRPAKQWADDQLQVGLRGNQACLQCHSSYQREEALAQHTHHAANSSGSVCYNCHMPYTTYGLHKAIRSHQIDSPTVAASLATGRPNACNQCHLDQTLEWTSKHLDRWYGIPPVTLTEDERKTSAAVLWLLRGDAGQRALMAWSMGWHEAHEASGADWQAPFVAQLLEDPYDAVRLIAARTLRGWPHFNDVEADLSALPQERSAARQRVWDVWQRMREPGPLNRGAGTLDRQPRTAILIDETGALMRDELQRLLEQRDNREIRLSE